MENCCVSGALSRWYWVIAFILYLTGYPLCISRKKEKITKSLNIIQNTRCTLQYSKDSRWATFSRAFEYGGKWIWREDCITEPVISTWLFSVHSRKKHAVYYHHSLFMNKDSLLQKTLHKSLVIILKNSAFSIKNLHCASVAFNVALSNILIKTTLILI